MKKGIKIISIVLVLSMALAGCGGLNKNTEQTSGNIESTAGTHIGLEKNVYEIPEYKVNEGVKIIRASTSLNAADYGITPSGALFKTLIDGIEEKSGGKILIQLYPGNQLAGNTDEVISGLASGAFEISEVSAGSWGDYTTAFAPLNVPFMFKTIDVAHDIIDGLIGEKMTSQVIEDCNVIPISFMELGMRQITNSVKVIRTPSDFSRIKIRVQSDPIQIATFEALGASVVSVPFSELFTALQQKLCEAQENPIHNIISRKFYEVQPYMTLSDHGVTQSVVILGGMYWDTLTDEEKGWFVEIGKEATEASRTACAEQTDTLIKQVEAYGVTVTELSLEEKEAFIEKASDVWTRAEEIMGADMWNDLIEAIESAESRLGL